MTVTATSNSETSSFAAANVTVMPITVTLSPVYAALPTGGEQAFDASVTGTVDPGVTWSVLEGVDGGRALDGGVYRAPGAAGIYHLVATSVSDGTIRVAAPILVGPVMPQLQELDAGASGLDAASMADPVIVPIAFSGDPLESSIDDFAAGLGASDYWHQTTSEYGVGPLVSASPIVMAEAAPATIDNAQIISWLGTEIQTDSRFGLPRFEKIYASYYPGGTTVTLPGVGTGCIDFGAYNWGAWWNGQLLQFAVMPRCSGGTNLVGATAATSHEVIENLVDSQWMDDAHAIWAYAIRNPDGQAADQCDGVWNNDGTYDGTYTVERTWSNKSAREGHDLCVPVAPGEVYMLAIPIMDDAVTLYPDSDAGIPTTGVKIPVGGSRTIDVDLFADGPTGSWSLSADDIGTGTLTFAFDQATGSNGDVRKLTITVNSASAKWGGEPFEIVSSQGGATHSYYGFVGN